MPERHLSARQRFLQAGREALAAGDLNLLADGLVIDRHVTPRAQLSKQTFSTTYPRRTGGGGGKELYLRELLRTVMAGTRRTAEAIDDEVGRRTRASGGDPRTVIRGLCEWNLEQIRTDPATQLRLVVAAAAGGDPAATAAVRDEYARLTTISERVHTEAMQRWGASLRQPFTVEMLAVVMTALGEGLALRARFDPEAVPDDLFGHAAVALFASVLDPDQTHGHIDDTMAALAEKAVGGFRSTGSDSLPDDPEHAIISAATAEFAERGYFSTTRTQIATSAEVAPALVDTLFPTTPDIVVAGLATAFGRLAKRTESDARYRPSADVLRRYLTGLAELIGAHRTLVEAMTLIISVERFQSPSTVTRVLTALDFPGLIVAAIESAQEKHEIVDDVPAATIATTLVNNVLILSLRDPRAVPAEVAATVERLCLRGLLADADGAGPPS
ncbi:TetR/AcrR family transcriptional regulator [Nocardia sp. NPDC057353]|uniref:TetR/AcrR family transcriptional regulator n=1 Tax=Nocardia sp. NPDC057353 TaxID=3346104 RepID=UPI003625CBD3